ncbi:MAG TPA: protein phosphatase 2C domain-containing protein [Gemmatimonadaceae bacterium]|nr:protein phosphatase 2C domain-containing protein [Gemmatimonadaceae bacterium]
MALADLLTTTIVPIPGERPRDDELDLFGLTHRGKVRKENQDHFLLATVHPRVVVHGTSLPAPEELPLMGQRLATILLVADGVGGGTGGGEASQVTVEAIARYVSSTLRCYHAAGSHKDDEFLEELRAAASEAHAAVKARSAPIGGRVMATTLTLGIVVWPWMYVVQVGDSRCYYYWDGAITQVTRDQTVAQDLVDLGVLPADRARQSPYYNVLARAIGSDVATPEVTRLDVRRRGSVALLCSDGLTKHVADDEIAEHIRAMDSSEQLCRALLDLALERGGRDNITVLAGRARPRADATSAARS